MLLTATAALAQTTAAPPAPAATAAPGENDETIVLSPFTVDASQDEGYFAENTLAGSRLNTNISDLGASISVITKQQMEDTASVDINDVFRYEVNTEGSLTYTPQQGTLRSDGLLDVNAGGSFAGGVVQTNATANRVRGIGTPSSAVNYYPSIGQLPMDSYNVTSLEISRGPNSMLFGMGSPAGIVNQSTAQAVLDRNTGSVGVRFDDRGSTRGTFSFNRSLIDGKLAIYGAVLYQDQQFERKPSYDVTRRQYGAVTFKPLRKTVLRGSVERYTNHNRRPNTVTPRDFVTEWRLAGSPMYDALTKTVTRTVNGQPQVSAPFIINALSPRANEVRNYIRALPGYNPALRGTSATNFNGTDANFTFYNGVGIYGEAAATNTLSSLYVPGLVWANQPRATMQIADGQLQNWFQGLHGQRYRTAWGTATNPAALAPEFATEAQIFANPVWADIYNRNYSTSNGWTQLSQHYPGTYKYPGVTDQSIYNWEKINVLQMNFGEEQNKTYNLELEQELLDNLFLNAGYFKQDFDSVSNYTVSQLNATTLTVDTNRYLPTGQPNPYAGKVYVEDTDPDQAASTEEHDHYRAMLAYTPDFTQKDGWLQWLGRHQILGLWSKQDSLTSYRRNRLHYVDSSSMEGKIRYMANQNNNADGTPTGWNRQTTSVRRAFYLAAPGDPDGVVTRGSGEWDHNRFSGDVTVYDYAAGQFKPINVTQEFITHNATTGRNQREIESLSAGMTNYLWNDRLVTTFGVRRDEYRARATTNAAILAEDGTVLEPALTPQQQFVNGVYQVETVFNRWNRWDELSGTTRTMGGVFKPFKNWNSIENRADSGSFWWEFVRDFGISYNKSDNFNAPASAQVDPFGNPLPKPTGEGTDIGLQFSALDNKLFARITWFEASNENERINAGTALGRLTGHADTTAFRNWARTIAKINLGMDPTGPNFDTALPPAQEEAVRAAVEPIWQQPYLYYENIGSIGATQNAEAEGVEVSVNYNPTPAWTMKLTGGKQETVYSDVLKEFDAWHAVRDPIWKAARAADYLLPQYQNLATYTSSGGRQVNLTNFWSSYGFDTNIRLDEPNGNFNVQLYYDGVVAPQAALARDLDGQVAPNQRRYRWSFLTNYRFEGERFKGFFVGGSQRWEDRAVIGYFGRSSGANPDPLFLDVSDVTRPIYDEANFYTDLWIGYQHKLMNDKIRMRIQLNVDNVFESGGLQLVDVNYDGSPAAYRIVDPRVFKLSSTFDF